MLSIYIDLILAHTYYLKSQQNQYKILKILRVKKKQFTVKFLYLPEAKQVKVLV